MIKIVTIIGARPQIIKAAAISRAIQTDFSDQIQEILVHTGQHYDENMSNVFFDELEIPRPDYNLQVGSGSHGVQTARMIEGIEQILEAEKPNFLILYGDTNSTLAGAVAASKIHIPIVHIEAGLRSWNKKMPEEINRILTDHCSTFLFSPTETGMRNLIREGFNDKNKPPYTCDHPKICNLGDVMLDNSLFFAEMAEQKSKILEQLSLEKNAFVLCTIHRNDNTDKPEKLAEIFNQLQALSTKHKTKLVLPLHPRTKKNLEQLDENLQSNIRENEHILIIDPVSFLDMILLEKYADVVVTDSGGVQKEAYFFGKPCLIIRDETEWSEIVEEGMAHLVQPNRILETFELLQKNRPTMGDKPLFGDGKAAHKMLLELLENSHKI